MFHPGAGNEHVGSFGIASPQENTGLAVASVHTTLLPHTVIKTDNENIEVVLLRKYTTRSEIERS